MKKLPDSKIDFPTRFQNAFFNPVSVEKTLPKHAVHPASGNDETQERSARRPKRY